MIEKPGEIKITDGKIEITRFVFNGVDFGSSQQEALEYGLEIITEALLIQKGMNDDYCKKCYAKTTSSDKN
jgi:hypothetical protein